ncbi:hypothetical protein [Marinomonas posidonica]|uniref:Uncharacterized protein n=1 Tax=Marinomonas posidonica (strain CECT 7376 / NCIMB 14433 / IVIA-Po-181) TaxID=491952 RepID=F6CTJ5_MARPP|nr:hypothetical protein [Marinomonas posidonica]AEF54044.1 hypothetical protein Mar181_0995 [Marinomonas posidonica IVIA-Po-181]
MLVKLAFVAPTEDEQQYMVSIDLLELPREGDRISFSRVSESGSEDFIVREVRWNLAFNDTLDKGEVLDVWVTCEFAETFSSKESHKSLCAKFKERTGVHHQF